MATRDDLVAALSMGAVPPAAADPRWQRLTDAVLAKEKRDTFGERLADWWDKSTFFRPAAESAVSAATLPGDVMAGKVDPYSQEAIERAADLSGMVTLGAGALPAKGAELGMGIRAYHGSPHSFDKFSMEKIGTGEGAQAYGHGLYFAEKEGVARDYRTKLANNVVTAKAAPDVDPEVARTINDYASGTAGNDPSHARQDILDQLEREIPDTEAFIRKLGPENYSQHQEVVDSLPLLYRMRDAILADKVSFKLDKGNMYEVDIAAEPEQFLDWDKPLSQQSEAVQKAMQVQGYTEPAEWLPRQYRTIGYTAKRELQKPEEVARLREAGIPGIKFLDQQSRFHPAILPDNPIADEARQFLEASGGDADAALKAFHASNPADRFATTERDEISKIIKQGGKDVTSNYVVFDDKLISILRKYGMAGMVGTAAGYEMAQKLLQQEDAQRTYGEGGNTL